MFVRAYLQYVKLEMVYMVDGMMALAKNHIIPSYQHSPVYNDSFANEKNYSHPKYGHRRKYTEDA